MPRDYLITCRRCNSKMSSGSRFCGTCGAAIPLNARQRIPTHGAPWTLIIVTTLPLVMIFGISIALALTGASENKNASIPQEPARTSDKIANSSTENSPTVGEELSTKEPNRTQLKETNEPKKTQPKETKKSQPAKASRPAPGYNLIVTPDDSLSVEIPPSWGVQTGESSEKEGTGPGTWSYYAGVYLTASITTGASLDGWYDQSSSGAYLVASKALARDYTDYQLTHSLMNAKKYENCTAGPYEDIDRASYSGKIQTWYECGKYGVTTFSVVASPPGRDCIVVLGARIADEADSEAIEHLIDSVEGDCGHVTS